MPSLVPWSQARRRGERQRSPVDSVLRAAEDQGEQSLQDRALEERTTQREDPEALERIPAERSVKYQSGQTHREIA